MSKVTHVTVAGLTLLSFAVSPVTHAAEQTTSTIYETLKLLTTQVETLAAQVRQRALLPETTSVPTPETIRQIQSALSTDASLYPEGLVTGYFGPLTAAALTRLQARYGLPETGLPDNATVAIATSLTDSTRASSTNLCANPLLQKTRFCSTIPEDPTPSSTVPSSITTNYLETGYETASSVSSDLSFSGVTVKRDLSYGDKEAEKFDLYRPSDSSQLTPLPTVIMVHGGGWKRGDKGMGNILGSKVEYFTGRDYNFISINYPLENIDPEEQVTSVARAMKYFQSNARRLGIDTDRLALMGHSAGAHLVTLLTSDRALRREFRLASWQATIALDSAGYNIPTMMEAGHLPTIYGPAFGEDPEFWKDMSPYHQYRGSTENFLLVCSTTRPDDACGEAEKFQAKVTSVTRSKDSATLLPVALNHAEVNNQVGVPGDYTESIQSFLTANNLP
jgi:peptidoglycan hydrolase-like protein with peptidoglycan-binding domain